MSSSGVVQELQTSFQLLWVKLQSLPKADVTEVVFFSLMLLFIGRTHVMDRVRMTGNVASAEIRTGSCISRGMTAASLRFWRFGLLLSWLFSGPDCGESLSQNASHGTRTAELLHRAIPAQHSGAQRRRRHGLHQLQALLRRLRGGRPVSGCSMGANIPPMPPPEHSPSQALEDLKARLLDDSWALGGLVVLGSFCILVMALLAFAALFGCCSGSQRKAGHR
ncbi:hypothetical protein NDU88_008473 [Pleurodeles waltl]|uniref:Uncharacterized protein n=1 Tax=Pleurodeles waltl TaxID=8319 RepID=A0AAV7PS13_PLEWA|nr:hypothetical protein NDU88_008473 [Pleurodeles waltl]